MSLKQYEIQLILVEPAETSA